MGTNHQEKGMAVAEQMRIAIIVNPELPVGLIANTTSAVGIGLAAKFPQLAGAVLSDSGGKKLMLAQNCRYLFCKRMLYR